MSKNFLAEIDGAEETVEGIPELAEGLRRLSALASTDPEAGLFRVRRMLEYMLRDLLDRKGNESPGTSTLENLIQRLSKKEILPRKLVASANFIRELGNLGVHGFTERIEPGDVEKSFEQLVPILVWYRGQLEPSPVVPAPVEQVKPTSMSRPRRVTRGRVALAGTLAAILVITAGAWWARWLTSAPAPTVVPIPDWAARLPVASALRIVYQSEAPASDRGKVARLAVALNVRRDGEAFDRPLKDDDSLTSADSYYLDLDLASGGHLYVFQVDSLGKLTALHPLIATAKYSSGINPVTSRGHVRIPPLGKNLHLDENIGIEHIYLVLNAGPWPLLEGAVAQLDASSMNPESPSNRIEQPFHLSLRGVGGTTTTSVLEAARPTDQPALSRAEYQGEGPMLVVERWFRHDPAPRSKGP